MRYASIAILLVALSVSGCSTLHANMADDGSLQIESINLVGGNDIHSVYGLMVAEQICQDDAGEDYPCYINSGRTATTSGVRVGSGYYQGSYGASRGYQGSDRIYTRDEIRVLTRSDEDYAAFVEAQRAFNDNVLEQLRGLGTMIDETYGSSEP